MAASTFEYLDSSSGSWTQENNYISLTLTDILHAPKKLSIVLTNADNQGNLNSRQDRYSRYQKIRLRDGNTGRIIFYGKIEKIKPDYDQQFGQTVTIESRDNLQELLKNTINTNAKYPNVTRRSQLISDIINGNTAATHEGFERHVTPGNIIIDNNKFKNSSVSTVGNKLNKFLKGSRKNALRVIEEISADDPLLPLSDGLFSYDFFLDETFDENDNPQPALNYFPRGSVPVAPLTNGLTLAFREANSNQVGAVHPNYNVSQNIEEIITKVRMEYVIDAIDIDGNDVEVPRTLNLILINHSIESSFQSDQIITWGTNQAKIAKVINETSMLITPDSIINTTWLNPINGETISVVDENGNTIVSAVVNSNGSIRDLIEQDVEVVLDDFEDRDVDKVLDKAAQILRQSNDTIFRGKFFITQWPHVTFTGQTSGAGQVTTIGVNFPNRYINIGDVITNTTTGLSGRVTNVGVNFLETSSGIVWSVGDSYEINIMIRTGFAINLRNIPPSNQNVPAIVTKITYNESAGVQHSEIEVLLNDAGYGISLPVNPIVSLSDRVTDARFQTIASIGTPLLTLSVPPGVYRNVTYDGVFSVPTPDSGDTIQWTAGTLTLPNGDFYMIAAGSNIALDSSQRTHIYFNTEGKEKSSQTETYMFESFDGSTIPAMLNPNLIILIAWAQGGTVVSFQMLVAPFTERLIIPFDENIYNHVVNIEFSVPEIEVPDPDNPMNRIMIPSDTIIQWNSGSITLSSGTKYEVNSGSLTMMYDAATDNRYFIYLFVDNNVLTNNKYDLQNDTDVTEAVGTAKILIAVARPAIPNKSVGASFLLYSGDETIVDGGFIAANTITANAIAANTITATQIHASTIDATRLTTLALQTSKIILAQTFPTDPVTGDYAAINRIEMDPMNGIVGYGQDQGTQTGIVEQLRISHLDGQFIAGGPTGQRIEIGKYGMIFYDNSDQANMQFIINRRGNLPLGNPFRIFDIVGESGEIVVGKIDSNKTIINNNEIKFYGVNDGIFAKMSVQVISLSQNERSFSIETTPQGAGGKTHLVLRPLLGDIRMDSNVLPDITGTKNLGSDTRRWSTLYVDTLNATNIDISELNLDLANIKSNVVPSIDRDSLMPGDPTPTYDLGQPTQPWNNIYANNLTINGAAFTPVDLTNVESNIVPDATNSRSLGLTDKLWSSVYTTNFITTHVNSHLIPFPDTVSNVEIPQYDLGRSDRAWRAIYTNSLTINGVAFTPIDLTNVESNIVPDTTNSRSLGLSDKLWSDVFTTNLSAINLTATNIIATTIKSHLISEQVPQGIGVDPLPFNLGQPTQPWNNIYANVLSATNLNVTTINAVPFTPVDLTNVESNIVPDATNSRSLGLTDKLWSSVYTTNFITTHVNSHLIPFPDTVSNVEIPQYDLGRSDRAWRAIYTNSLTINGVAFTPIDLTNVESNIVPDTTNSRSLGLSDKLWSDVFTTNLSAINLTATNIIATTIKSHLISEQVPQGIGVDPLPFNLGQPTQPWNNIYANVLSATNLNVTTINAVPFTPVDLTNVESNIVPDATNSRSLGLTDKLWSSVYTTNFITTHVNSHLIPFPDTVSNVEIPQYDLGRSDRAWRAIYTNSLTINGVAFTPIDLTNVESNIVPDTTNSRSLGLSDKLWSDVFTTNLSAINLTATNIIATTIKSHLISEQVPQGIGVDPLPFNLGQPTQPWNNIYANVLSATNLNVTTINAVPFTPVDLTNVESNIVPDATNSRSLGLTDKLWSSVYTTNFITTHVNSHLIPFPDTVSNVEIPQYDLGRSDRAWRAIYTNSLTINGVAFTPIDLTNVESNIVPDTTNSRSLGLSDKLWSDVFTTNLSAINLTATNIIATTIKSHLISEQVPQGIGVDPLPFNLGQPTQPWNNIYANVLSATNLNVTTINAVPFTPVDLTNVESNIVPDATNSRSLGLTDKLWSSVYTTNFITTHVNSHLIPFPDTVSNVEIPQYDLGRSDRAWRAIYTNSLTINGVAFTPIDLTNVESNIVPDTTNSRSLGLSDKLWSDVFTTNLSAINLTATNIIATTIKSHLISEQVPQGIGVDPLPFNLGQPTQPWNNIYANVLSATNLNVTTINAVPFTPVDLTNVESNIVPDATNSRSIGTSGRMWNNLYVNNIFGNINRTPINIGAHLISNTFIIGAPPNTATLTYDLGQSTRRWNNVYSNVLNTISLTVNGTAFTAIDLTNITSNIIPDTTNSRSLGASNRLWNTVYATNLNVTNLVSELADEAAYNALSSKNANTFYWWP